MMKSLSIAFSLDKTCSQAHLLAGEVAQRTAQRLTGEGNLKASKESEWHHRQIWEDSVASDGQKNMAGYRLCLDLIAQNRKEEARVIRDIVLSRVNSGQAIKNLNQLPL